MTAGARSSLQQGISEKTEFVFSWFCFFDVTGRALFSQITWSFSLFLKHVQKTPQKESCARVPVDSFRPLHQKPVHVGPPRERPPSAGSAAPPLSALILCYPGKPFSVIFVSYDKVFDFSTQTPISPICRTPLFTNQPPHPEKFLAFFRLFWGQI